ncbi:MAG: NfeD family protein [Epulopiscium sp.]|nr:NfeD family protein [Candidatus Epulonipiscium sp.]
MNYMWVVWLIFAIVFALIEISNTSFFIVWFSIGSLAALITSLFIPIVAIQLLVFLVVSTLLLIFTRRISKSFFHSRPTYKTNIDTLKNALGIVTQEIDNAKGTGQVKIKGEIWSAISASDTIIPSNTKIIVLELRGVKLVVEQDFAS